MDTLMTLRKRNLAFFLSLLLLPITTQAYTGNDLLAYMEGYSNHRAAAMGYIEGVHDATKGIKHYCLPATVTQTQVWDLTWQFLKKNPAIRHHHAPDILLSLFKAHWPCSGILGEL